MGSDLSILMGGDIIVMGSNPVSSIFGDVVSLLRGADITLLNLEGPICEEKLQPLPGKAKLGSEHHVRMPLGAEQRLAEIGIDAVSIATNHSGDYGEEGILQTIEALDRVGIGHAGGGRNIEESHRPCILERKRLKVALLSYTSVYVPVSFPATENKPGVAVVEISTAYQVPFNVAYQPGTLPLPLTYANAEHKKRLLEDIHQAKQNADLLIVAFHWGVTRRGNARSLRIPIELCTSYALGYQEDLARAAIDAGADFIWGHHPHELQGIEVYKGKLICYSLGTFAFDIQSPQQLRVLIQAELNAAIVKCELHGGDWHYSYIPICFSEDKELGLPRVKRLDLKQGKYSLERIAIHSQKYGTTFVEKDDEVMIYGSPPGFSPEQRGKDFATLPFLVMEH